IINPPQGAVAMSKAEEDDFSPQGEKDQSSDTDKLDELRKLLVGPERKQIVEIRDQLETGTLNPDQVSRVLPEAIVMRQKKDKRFLKAIRPTVEDAIKITVQQRPESMISALFPVIKPLIRKAIAQALRDTIQTLNQVLEKSLSIRSLKWRFEALRTGRSFAEVVLLHTLSYRVEQVFLIHKETGLLLQHVAAAAVETEDGDMVSSMLTAIRDFAHDSFRLGSGEDLETLRVGDLTILIEQSPLALVAAVIRGNLSPDIQQSLQDALENIHLEQSTDLEEFNGDTAPFEQARPHLEACLLTEYEKKSSPSYLPVCLLAGAIILILSFWGFLSVRNGMRWRQYLQLLDQEPGVVVVETEKRGGTYHLSGLRDPLARDPDTLLEKAKVDPQDFKADWETYHALYPPFILARSKEVLNAPDTVELTLEDGVLQAQGTASRQWIDQAGRLATVIPGVTGFRDVGLTVIGTKTDDSSPVAYDVPENREVEFLTKAVERKIMFFGKSSSSLGLGQERELFDLAENLKRLDKVAAGSGKRIRVIITGHTDSIGSTEINNKLSLGRAQHVLSNLESKGVPARLLTGVGVGSSEPLLEERIEEDRKFNRRVTFDIQVFSGSGQ
ncbi:OmpA family protein, partial [Acidobacteriota bacterium]